MGKPSIAKSQAARTRADAEVAKNHGPHRHLSRHQNGDIHYAAKNLGLAVYVLATDNHILRYRLAHAYSELQVVFPADLSSPKDVRDLNWIKSTLTRKPATNYRSSVLVTVATMNVSMVKKIACRICELADRVAEQSRDKRQ